MEQFSSAHVAEWQRGQSPLKIANGAADAAGAPFTVNGRQLLNEGGEPIPFLLEGVLQQTGLACLAGSSDTGKSCLLRQLAVAVSVGDESFIGFKLNLKHRAAIYVSTEDGKDATAFLLSRQSQQHAPEKLRELY